MARRSFRTLFREFQRMRGAEPEGAFVADLEYLENRGLDLSVRLGAMLAFDAPEERRRGVHWFLVGEIVLALLATVYLLRSRRVADFYSPHAELERVFD